MNEEKDYSDMLSLPHPTSKKHQRMSLYDRAAQFSPFAALTGYENALQEESRSVEKDSELSEEEKAKINDKIRYLLAHKKEKIVATFHYFLPDSKKDGGSYQTKTGYIKRIDEINKTILLQDEKILAIEKIKAIESPLFDDFESEDIS